jgi:hypothetical protein
VVGREPILQGQASRALFVHFQITEGNMERGINVGFFSLKKTSPELLSETACALLQYWLDSNKVQAEV